MDQLEPTTLWNELFDDALKQGYDSQPTVPFFYDEVSNYYDLIILHLENYFGISIFICVNSRIRCV